MRTFLCPFCGAIHTIDDTKTDLVFLCKSCNRICFIKGDKAVAPSPEEIAEIDNGTFLGVPSNFRLGRGIPIPMMDGQPANCRIGDSFYHIPDWISAADLVATVYARSQKADMVSLEESIKMSLASDQSEVDVHRLREKVVRSRAGHTGWAALNEQFGFFLE